MKVAILTISDRAADGIRPDASGPAIEKLIRNKGWEITRAAIVPDDMKEIQTILENWCDDLGVDIILTTGGTGFSPRDVTPEATRLVIQREAPGIAEAMRLESLKITPHAMLSRAIAGIRNKTLIINLPGSPKAAMENLSTVIDVLPHAVELLHENPNAETGHSFPQLSQQDTQAPNQPPN